MFIVCDASHMLTALRLDQQALHALLKSLDAALAPVPGLSKHNYGVSQHGFCVSAGLTGRCDDHAAAALDAALRLQEAARQVGSDDAWSERWERWDVLREALRSVLDAALRHMVWQASCCIDNVEYAVVTVCIACQCRSSSQAVSQCACPSAWHLVRWGRGYWAPLALCNTSATSHS